MKSFRITNTPIIIDYLNGDGFKNLQQKYKLGTRSIRQILSMAGVEIRPAGVQIRHANNVGNRRLHPSGYVRLRTKDGWVEEHRWLVEKNLGRKLLRTETVHHINGIRDDNRLENLQLRFSDHGPGVSMICMECGSDRLVYKEI